MSEQLGNVKRYRKSKGYESISRDMLQDEENLSLEAIGLLANLLSYSDDWDLNKTELYNRFSKSKRTKIQNTWNELVSEGYILQFRKRSGYKYDYIYYFQDERFTDEDVKIISDWEKTQVWDGKISDDSKSNNKKTNDTPHDNSFSSNVDFQQSNFNSRKSTPKRSITNEVYDKHQDTYKDTKSNDIEGKPQNHNNTIQRDKILKDSLKDSVSKELHYTLSVFAEDYNQMNNWVGIIFRAKDEIVKRYDVPITLEDYDTILANMFKSFARKYKTDSSITNPDSYLFITIRNGLDRTIGLERRQHKEDSDDIYYNWLEE